MEPRSHGHGHRSLSSCRDIPVPLGKCAESFFKRARGCDKSGLIRGGSRFPEIGWRDPNLLFWIRISPWHRETGAACVGRAGSGKGGGA